jgi:hypothetical protein
MTILETIAGAQGGGAVQQLANQFGLKPDQAKSAVGALMPALAAGLQRNMASESGLSGLINALGNGSHDTYLNDPNTLARPETVADGNAILGHVLGSKDVSRQVAAQAAQKTGIDTSILKKMLPLVAALAMGGLSRQTKTAGGAPTAGGLASMLGPLLDRDRDGSVMDDVAGMVGGMLGGRKRG